MPRTFQPDKYREVSARDGLCVEHLNLMNAAFCRYYRRIGCEARGRMPPACADGGAEFTRGARLATHSQNKCVDEHDGCASWARMGECAKNPGFMHTACTKACGSCSKHSSARKGPSALPEDSAPCARPVPPRAPAAPTASRAPPEQLAR